MTNEEEFKVGDYVVCLTGIRVELGRVKRVEGHEVFVCYHEGETVSLTPYEYLSKIDNEYVITETKLGGGVFDAEEV